MASTLQVALIQTHLVWENPIQNRQLLSQKIESLSDTVDIIVLPEMFTTGFTMNASNFAETMQGDTVNWMLTIAKQRQVAITGSLIIKEHNQFYNRLLFVHPDGKMDTYDKRHTFTLAGEDKVFASGTEKKIIHYKGWKLCPMICYDLRFPVWSRNVEAYDVLFYVANWPNVRIQAWDTLLKARAIENMAYCIGVNRIGLDGNNHEYSGHSAVYDVLGNRIDHMPFDKEAIEIVTLYKSDIETYRQKLNFLGDMDSFTLR
jgi:predicted amidohydrolase